MEMPPALSPVKQALREQLLQRATLGKDRHWEIPVRTNRSVGPLSYPQRQMWVLDQMNPGNPAYNLSIGFRLRGPLQVKALEDSFHEVIKRHESLRTTFGAKDGEPLQLVHPTLRFRIEVTDLEHLDLQVEDSRLQALAADYAIQPFDLARLPLLRAGLFRLSEAEHILIISAHHIVADGLSIHLLLEELDLFYRAFTLGAAPRLRDLRLRYLDFAFWQQQTAANGAAYTHQIEFWQKQLGSSLPILDLPTDMVRPPRQSFNGSNAFFNLPGPLVQNLRSLGAPEGCTLFMTLLAAFQVLLLRYSGAEDIVIGTPMGARTATELEPLIGDFLNMTALRCDVSGDPNFVALLRRTRDMALEAFANSDVPFGVLMKHLRFERDLSRNALFQVMLEVSTTPTPRLGDLELARFNFDLRIAQFDLSLHLWNEGDNYRGRFEYCTDLFHRETVERLSASFQRLLGAIASNPQEKIGKLPILAPAERRRILVEWNETAADFPADLVVHQLFERQAARTPGRAAVTAGGKVMSYAELEARANCIAQGLRSRGVGRGQRVGLCLQRDTEMVAAALGILKAGAAYVPLDPSLPEARLRFMADDAQLSLLVSRSDLAGRFGLSAEGQWLLDGETTRQFDGLAYLAAIDGRKPTLSLDAASLHETSALLRAAATNPEVFPEYNAHLLKDRQRTDFCNAQPDDPAYIIYTSGSTGRPKGVLVPHRAVVNFLTSMAREPGLRAEDVLLAVTTLSFDIAVLELFLPLSVGASVIIATQEDVLDGHALATLLDRYGVTVMQATPVTWRLLLETGWTPRRPFKALAGGETLTKELAGQLLAAGVELWNMYGPTETTVWSTCARIRDNAERITIGRPIANTVIRVLNSQRQLCPIGVPGELCIGGLGVSLGYWNRPALTAERFTPDPFDSTSGARLYCTGDRARWCADGTLEHLGRLDSQVKLRGFRIELGEIEAAIAQHPLVREVAVVAREDTPGDKRLVGYVAACHTTRDNDLDLEDQLRKLARSCLPEYMIPAHFVMLEALPRTPNGKVDRQALLPPTAADTSASRNHVGPRTHTEEMVLGLFRDVLGRTDFGLSDSFFDLGGNSLMAARLMLALRAASSRDVALRLLFERQNVSALAEAIEALQYLPNAQPEPSLPGNRVEIEL